jgi:hypothetical protein
MASVAVDLSVLGAAIGIRGRGTGIGASPSQLQDRDDSAKNLLATVIL